MHAFTYDGLLALELFLARLVKLLLELFVGCTRFHYLFHLVLGVLDNLISSLLLSLKQLDSIVESDAVKFNLLTTLSNLRD